MTVPKCMQLGDKLANCEGHILCAASLYPNVKLGSHVFISLNKYVYSNSL